MQNLLDLEAVLCLSGLDNYLLCKKFAVQTFVRPLEFVIELISSTKSSQFETWLEVEISQIYFLTLSIKIIFSKFEFSCLTNSLHHLVVKMLITK